MTTPARLAILVLAMALVVAPACSSVEDGEPLAVTRCGSAEIATDMDAASDVHVFVDADLAPIVQADLGSYLTRLWWRSPRGRQTEPRGLETRRTPMTKVRGLQIHLLHPLEHYSARSSSRAGGPSRRQSASSTGS